jgi:hypothetical protein
MEAAETDGTAVAPDPVADKVAELEKQYGVTVYPVVFKDEEGKDVVGYLKNPSRVVKLRVLDKSIMSPISAGAELLEVCLIKEASDPRIFSEAPENDTYNLGAAMAASRVVAFSTNQFKKN